MYRESYNISNFPLSLTVNKHRKSGQHETKLYGREHNDSRRPTCNTTRYTILQQKKTLLALHDDISTPHAHVVRHLTKHRSAGNKTSLSVLLIGGPKCTLAASNAAPWRSYHGEYADGKDRQTDGRTPDRYITLSTRYGVKR